MTRRKLLFWIPLLALLLNGVGYLVVRKARTPVRPVETSDLRAGIPGPQETEHTPMGSSSKRETTEQAAEAQGLARREAGLAALEAGDYEKALIKFTEAQALLGDKANVTALVRLAEDLRKRPGATVVPRPREHEVAASRSPSSYRPSFRAQVRRVTAKEEPGTDNATAGTTAAGAASASAGAGSGLIVVSTTPRGLLVHVDETPIDITPMRAKVRPGAHRVALFDGDRKIYETSVDVREGATATLTRDFPAEAGSGGAGAGRPLSAATPATAGARDEAPAPTTGDAAELTAPASLVAPAAPQEGLTGNLQITSPGLYGVVWINGRARGYPPLEVRDLPAGPVKIEVRVNGVEKRSSMVVVQPGLTTSVALRALEVVP